MASPGMDASLGREDGERYLRDPGAIRAYLASLLAEREPVGLTVPGHPTLSGLLAGLDPGGEAFRVRLARAAPWTSGQELCLTFALDGIRLEAPVTYLGPGGFQEARFARPALVTHAERRSRMRAQFSPREKATVTVLEGLAGSRGATGALVDLSQEGLRMRVERAVALPGRSPLPVGPGTFVQGTRFPVLRIDQLPYSPVVVCQGVVAHVAVQGEAILMGIRFEGLGEMEAQAIRQVLGRRLPKFNQGFPERTPARLGGSEEASPAVLIHRDIQGGFDLAPEDARRASRRLLVAVEDDLDRAVVVSALRQEGFRKLHEARGFKEALDHVRVFAMDAAVVADSLGGVAAEVFLERLRAAGHCREVPAVLLAGHLDARVAARAREGRFDHVHLLDGGAEEALSDVLEHLLNLPPRAR